MAYNQPLKKKIKFEIIYFHYIKNGYVVVSLKNVGIRKFVLNNFYIYYTYGIFNRVTTFYKINDGENPIIFPYTLDAEDMIKIKIPFYKFVEIMNSDQHFVKMRKPKMIRFKVCVEEYSGYRKLYKAHKILEFPNNLLRLKFRYVKHEKYYYKNRDCNQCFKGISNYSKFPCIDWINSINAKTCYNYDEGKRLDINAEYMSYKNVLIRLRRSLYLIYYLIMLAVFMYIYKK